MSHPNRPMLRAMGRGTVLTLALVLGIAAALLAGRDDAHHAATPIVFVAGAQAAPTLLAQAPSPEKAPAEAATKSEPPKETRAGGKGVDVEITVNEKGASVRQGEDRARIVVADDSHQNFDNLVANAAPVAIVAVLSVFLTPLLLTVLVIWYKMRRARMLNETMLKLAERGVVPPAEAMSALAGGPAGQASVTAAPSAAPLYEQARSVRRRTAWSDLRKGVLMVGIGLALSMWSLIDDGSANPIGLILLFVGAGYCVLWYFEDRKADPRTLPPPAPPGGA